MPRNIAHQNLNKTSPAEGIEYGADPQCYFCYENLRQGMATPFFTVTQNCFRNSWYYFMLCYCKTLTIIQLYFKIIAFPKIKKAIISNSYKVCQEAFPKP